VSVAIARFAGRPALTDVSAVGGDDEHGHAFAED
jgi:hypothetical protein